MSEAAMTRDALAPIGRHRRRQTVDWRKIGLVVVSAAINMALIAFLSFTKPAGRPDKPFATTPLYLDIEPRPRLAAWEAQRAEPPRGDPPCETPHPMARCQGVNIQIDLFSSRDGFMPNLRKRRE